MNQPVPGLSAPLRVRPDMAPLWRNLQTDFDSAANELVRSHQQDGIATDVPATDLRTWALRASQGHYTLAPLAGYDEPRALRQTALSNLMARIGAPADFIRTLPAELQLANLNFLLASQDRLIPSQLRVRGSEVTAIVSDRYAPLDAEQFVESIRLALRQHGLLGQVQVRALATGTTDALRLVFPERKVELQVGDVSHIGLDISTSSFGKSAIHVTGQVFRLACLNGLRVPESIGRLSLRHVGQPARLRDGLRDAIPTALTHASGLMDCWKRSLAAQIDHVSDLIEGMRELTIGEREGLEKALTEEHGTGGLPAKTSVYSFVNGLTAAAHAATPARRLDLESLAGRVLFEETRS